MILVTKAKSLAIVCGLLWIVTESPAAILKPVPPKGGKRIALVNAKEDFEPSYSGASPKEMIVSDPYQCYTGNTIIDGKILAHAQLWSWIYPVLHGGRAIGEVELSANEKFFPLLYFLSSTEGGGYADDTLSAAKKVEQLPGMKSKKYQLRRLKLLPLQFRAVWFHADSEDLLIPLAPAPEGLVVGQVYSETEVVRFLQPIADRPVILK